MTPQEEADKLAQQLQEYLNTGKEPEGLKLPDEVKAIIKEGIGILAVSATSPMFAHLLMQFGMEDGQWAIQRIKALCVRVNKLHETGQALHLVAYMYNSHFHAGTESQEGEDDLEALWLAANSLNILLSRKLSEKYKQDGLSQKERKIMSAVLQQLALSFLDDPSHNSSLAVKKRESHAQPKPPEQDRKE